MFPPQFKFCGVRSAWWWRGASDSKELQRIFWQY
jgi:hypothetical protein